MLTKFINFLAAEGLNSDKLMVVAQPMLELCSNVLPVLLAIVGAVGAIFCVVLGVKYAKADDPQEHEKAKNGLKNAIIGFVLIFVLLIALQLGVSVLQSWWAQYDYTAV